jgi:hypothetical protein
VVHVHGFAAPAAPRAGVELVTIPDENGVAREHVLAACGPHLGLLRLDDQRMCFLDGANAKTVKPGAVREILALCLSPNRKHVAICERVTEVGHYRVTRARRIGGAGNDGTRPARSAPHDNPPSNPDI